MATNRDKLNKMTNEELANKLAELFSSIISKDLNRMIENIENPRIVKMPNGTGISCKPISISTYNVYYLNKVYVSNKILEWFSQEAEEQTQDELKEKTIDGVEDYYERDELYQLDKGKFKSIPKSADEMFEELGYEKM